MASNKTSVEGPQYYVANRAQLQIGGENGKKGLVYRAAKEFNVGDEVPVKSLDGEVQFTVAILGPKAPYTDRNRLVLDFGTSDLGPNISKRIKVLKQNAPSGFQRFECECPGPSQVYSQDPVLDLVRIESGLGQGKLVNTVVIMVLGGHALMFEDEFLNSFWREQVPG